MSKEAGERLDRWLKYIGENPTDDVFLDAMNKWERGIEPPEPPETDERSWGNGLDEMRAPKLSTLCGLCQSQEVDRRSLYGGDGPDEAAERWKCATCGATAWLYCDGTLSYWQAKARKTESK
jgi:hypothetical protein